MEEWERSGETQTVFCLRQGIKLKLFRNHRYEIMKKARQGLAQAPSNLLPVHVVPAKPSTPILTSPELFLQFPNGMCLRFSAGTPVDYVSGLSLAMMPRRVC